MSKVDIVDRMLQQKGSLTTLEIQQLVWTTCPHSVIRDVRSKHKDGEITDEWITKTKVFTDEKGKEHKITTRYKKFFWNAK